jgi:hypothetical protein
MRRRVDAGRRVLMLRAAVWTIGVVVACGGDVTGARKEGAPGVPDASLMGSGMVPSGGGPVIGGAGGDTGSEIAAGGTIFVLVTGGTAGGGATNESFDAGSGADIDFDGGTATALACEHQFEATYESPCGGPVLPDGARTRFHRLFMRMCTESQLPGFVRTAAELEACAADMQAAACDVHYGLPASCYFRGTLPGGAPCSDDAQCASATCGKIDTCSPEGCGPRPPCGQCAPVAKVGEPCSNGGCESGAVCDTQTVTADGVYRCAALTYGATGASCDDIDKRCMPGLFCDLAKQQCAERLGLGAVCDSSSASGLFSCRPSLTCSGTPSSCHALGVAGDRCVADEDCARGLACSGVCQAVTWARPGQQCDRHSVLCLVGQCPADRIVPTGICPNVLPDGSPCSSDGSDTCDAFSECINGTCAPHGAVACAAMTDAALP